MDVLQIGPENWAEKYQLPDDMKWEFNAFPAPKKHGYDVVLVTGKNDLNKNDWLELQWLVDPYHVLYTPANAGELTKEAYNFLKLQSAKEIMDEPQTVIDFLPRRYFFGQSGARYSPLALIPLMDRIQSYQILDAGHVLMKIDSGGQWLNIGTYRNGLFIDPDKIIKFWLTYQASGLAVRLRVFIQPFSGNGDPKDSFTLDVSSMEELQLPIKVTKEQRAASVSVEVKGRGTLKLGILHSRWGRDGAGEFLVGGHRIVDPHTREDIAYFFSPGDLNPPLNVYFAGARSLEGFEAYPMFRYAKAPALLFTDMRLDSGQFYTGQYFEEKIKEVICAHLKRLGFDRSQLIMNGISMGSYGALKYGAELGAYAINAAKMLGNLGLIAERGRIERPAEFTTIYDIDKQLVPTLSEEDLQRLDHNFWVDFNQADLSQTRLFISYMEDDDYDNQSIQRIRDSVAVRKAREFTSRGFPGHHNDDRSVNRWFVNRLYQMLVHDFGRKE